jgi:hypothetical protein
MVNTNFSLRNYGTNQKKKIHRGNYQIGIYFGFEEHLKAKSTITPSPFVTQAKRGGCKKIK